VEQRLLYKIYVRGLVQGVGFRWRAAMEARSRGITGFVRNMPDGSVYIEAEGTRDQLEDFIGWCRRGPAFSSVESVETESHPPVNYIEFRIIH
jgi:acylphosphatase